MAVTAQMNGQLLKAMFNGEVDIVGANSVKVMLTTNAYSFDPDTHEYRNSVTNEVVGTAYVAGGATCANPVLSYDTATNTVKFTCDTPITWATSTITARRAVFYVAKGGASSADNILCVWDFGADESSVGADFRLNVPGTGLIAGVHN